MALGFPAGLPPYCPYSDCLGNSASKEAGPVSSRFVRNGRYWRAEDSKLICRYKCLQCKRSFSSARFSACFGQKKRKVNAWVEKLYYSGVSQRRMARLLKLNHKTVERKIVFLGGCAEKDNLAFLKELGASEKTIKIHRGQVMQKMKAESLVHLVRMAEKLGVAPSGTTLA